MMHMRYLEMKRRKGSEGLERQECGRGSGPSERRILCAWKGVREE